MTKKIVLLGDSMTDTFDFGGNGFIELKKELEKLNPSNDINLVNHGVGSTDVVLGLERITKPYQYKGRGRNLPAIIDENPDVVIIESFAYNHWSDSKEDLDKYIRYHQEIIQLLQNKTQAKIILLATIAPNKDRFASGVMSLDWDDKMRLSEYNLVMKYLSVFLEFAQSSELPFVDLFTPSLTSEQTGDLKYISNVDYIHLSFEGRTFIAQNLAPQIIENY